MKKFYLTLVMSAMALTLSAQPAMHFKQLPGMEQEQKASSTPMALPRQKAMKAPKRASILSEQPEGVLHDGLTRSSLSMTTSLGKTTDNVKFEGKVCKWVEGVDGCVYLYDPIVAYHADAWMQGEWGGRGEDGDTLWFTGPQLMLEETYSAYSYSYFAQRLQYSNGSWAVNKRNQKTMFIWRDGTLSQPSIKNVGFGYVGSDGSAHGLMDHSSVAVPLEDTPIELSEELLAKKKEMMMRYCDTYLDTAWNSRKVQMVVDEANNALYLQNMCAACPEAWIKGDIKGNKVTIADKQFLGIYEDQQYYAYNRGITTKKIWWEEGGFYYYDFDYGKELTFDYDPATGRLTSDGSGMVIIPGKEATYYINYYLHPQIVPLTGEAKAPAPPVFEHSFCYQFGDWNNGGMAPYLSLQFALPTFSEDGGTYLDPSKMSYVIYLDTMKYVLQPDEYSTLTEPMEEIPYEFTDDYYLYVQGLLHAFYLFEDCDSLGIQSIYTDGDTRLASTISYYQMTNASAFTSRLGTSYYDNTSRTWGTTPTGKKESYDVAKFLGTSADKGQKIAGVRVKLGKASVKNLKVWAATSLDQIENGAWTAVGEGLAMKASESTTGEVEVMFDETVIVPNTGLYLGYSFDIDEPGGDNVAPVVLLKTKVDGAFWCHTSRTYRHWRDLSYYGTIDMDAIKVNIPDNAANFGSIKADVTVLGEDAKIQACIVNAGNNGVRTMTYTYTVNGQTETRTISLGTKPVGSTLGDSAVVTLRIPGETFTKAGMYPMTLTIDKVNSQPNGMTAEGSVAIPVYATLPHHRSVEEEYTGTWCGWCPRGLKALELMNERHPDDFIALSYHNGDVMTLRLDYPSSVSGFPSAWIDRIISADPYGGTSGKALGIEDDWKKCLAAIAPADIEMTALLNDTKTKVDVSADFMFAVSDDNSHYKVDYILVHDSLHGEGSKWAQQNYYSSSPSSDPNLKEFNTAGSRIANYFYNDVVVASSRQSTQGGGYRNLPTKVTESEPVNDTFSFTLAKVVNDSGEKLIQDMKQLRVVALMIDKQTGAIVNAYQTKVVDPTGIAIMDADARNQKVEAVYDLNGRKFNSLRPGINIVRYSDGTTKAVMKR